MGFVEFLLMPIFHLTLTGPTTGSTESRVDPLSQSEFNNYGCIVENVVSVYDK
jgi:hypothetical protein